MKAATKVSNVEFDTRTVTLATGQNTNSSKPPTARALSNSRIVVTRLGLIILFLRLSKSISIWPSRKVMSTSLCSAAIPLVDPGIFRFLLS